MDHILSLDELETLELEDGRIGPLSEAGLLDHHTKLEKLKTLSLSHCAGEMGPILGLCPNLRAVDLSYTDAKDQDLDQLISIATGNEIIGKPPMIWVPPI